MRNGSKRPRSAEPVRDIEVVRHYAPDLTAQVQALLVVLSWAPQAADLASQDQTPQDPRADPQGLTSG